MSSNAILFVCLFVVPLAIPAIIEPPEMASIETQRNFVLSLINTDREENMVGEIYIDQVLNSQAQDLTDGMAESNKLSHFDSQGRSPFQVAELRQFYYLVRQLVGSGQTLKSTYDHMLSREGNKRGLLNEQNTRVGIGISKMPNGAFVLVLLFSTRDHEEYPYEEMQIKNITDYIVAYIAERDQYVQTENEDLSQTIQDWLDEGKPGQGIDYLTEKGMFVPGEMSLYGLYRSFYPPGPSLSDYIEQYDLSAFVRNQPTLKYVGIGVTGLNNGKVEIWIYYTS